MRIVSLNCWGGRIPGMVEWLKEIDADIYCLQEVYNSLRNISRLLYDDVSPSARAQKNPPVDPNLYTELRRALPQHEGSFWPTTRWQLDSGVKGSPDVETYFGIATFVRRGLPVPVAASKFVYQEFRCIPKTDLPTPRVAHVVRVIPENGSPLVVGQMHGLWIPEGKQDTPEREHQTRLFSRLIAQVREPCDRVVACGDWNVLPDSYTFSVLEIQHGLRDLVKQDGEEGTRTGYYKRLTSAYTPFADYMAVNSRVKVNNFEIVREPEISDHCPLVLDIE